MSCLSCLLRSRAVGCLVAGLSHQDAWPGRGMRQNRAEGEAQAKAYINSGRDM